MENDVWNSVHNWTDLTHNNPNPKYLEWNLAYN